MPINKVVRLGQYTRFSHNRQQCAPVSTQTETQKVNQNKTQKHISNSARHDTMNVTSPYPFSTPQTSPPLPPADSRNVEINGKIHRSDKSKNITIANVRNPGRVKTMHNPNTPHIAHDRNTMGCEPTHCGGLRHDNIIYIYISMIPLLLILLL